MEKVFDSSKTYAIALGGGGAKGGYEIGVWRALKEEGLKYNAVSGTSVGALNGALMAMGDLEKADELWRNIRYSQVIDVDDREMGRVFEKDVKAGEIRPLLRKAIRIVREGGFDVTPLRELLKKYIDTDRIRESDVDFVIVTYSLTDRREVIADVRRLPDGEMADMLLASAYFPAFRNEPLAGGKRYTDGGVSDALPINPLIDRGYKNIIAVRLSGGMGRERTVRRNPGVTVDYIEPKRGLGNVMDFSPEHSKYNLDLGYYDAKRFVYGLAGDYYYLERTMTERDAYNLLIELLGFDNWPNSRTLSLRAIHESVLPRLAKQHNASGDYYDVLIHYIEHTAEVFGLPEFRIIKDTDLTSEVISGMKARGVTTIAPYAFKAFEQK